MGKFMTDEQYIKNLESALKSIIKRIERSKTKSFEEINIHYLIVEDAKNALAAGSINGKISSNETGSSDVYTKHSTGREL